MTVGAFAELAEDFLRITAATVFCTATTVDAKHRPRARMLHPIFILRDERPLGWALTGRTPLKTRHLAANPHMSCAYWNPSQDTVFVDCVAVWAEALEEKQEGWELFRGTPPPLGYGPEGMAGYGPEQWRSPEFTPLRLEPWRVQVMTGEQYPHGRLTGRVWRDASPRFAPACQHRCCRDAVTIVRTACPRSSCGRWRPALIDSCCTPGVAIRLRRRRLSWQAESWGETAARRKAWPTGISTTFPSRSRQTRQARRE